MQRLPERPNLGHLKKQAKDLLALYRSGEPAAFARLRDALPAAAGKDDEAIRALGLRLHDAQSAIAREYGFASWAELDAFVAARSGACGRPRADGAQLAAPGLSGRHRRRDEPGAAIGGSADAGGRSRTGGRRPVSRLRHRQRGRAARHDGAATRHGSTGRAARSLCRRWSR